MLTNKHFWSNNDEEYRIMYRDSVVDVVEEIKVYDGRAVLSEIPDKFAHVKVDGYAEIYQESFEYLDTNTFMVNYNNGIVSFHHSVPDGTNVTARYKGKGLIVFPATRIYTAIEKGNVVKTFHTMVEDMKLMVKMLDTVRAGENPYVYNINGHLGGMITLDHTDVGAVSTATFNTEIAGIKERAGTTSEALSALDLEVSGQIEALQTDVESLQTKQVTSADVSVTSVKLTSTTVSGALDELSDSITAVDGKAIAASDVTVASANLTSTTMAGALDELFSSVSDGKDLIATAITDMGVTIEGSATFADLAQAIRQIGSSEPPA